MSWADGGAIPSAEEYDRWLKELQASNRTLADFADAARKKRDVAIADEANKAAGIFGGIPLPEEVRNAISVGKRVASFVQYLPLDENTKKIVEPIAEAMELLAHALGVK